MRELRIKNAPTENGFFHVVCRTVGKDFLFEKEEEKKRLLLWLDKAVEFCGVELLSWCVMSNHVHLLVKVPPRQEISDAELDRRMRVLYLPSRYATIMDQWRGWQRMDGNNRRVEEAKAKLRRRMFDLSWFMKTFKQAAAQDYNARHGFTGSMWGGNRFKSVYLEGTRKVLLAVAAYIHLNPVRAKMAQRAEEYAWSSWGEACAHSGRSRVGLLRLYDGIAPSRKMTWTMLKSQLQDVQTRVTTHREAMEELLSGKRTMDATPLRANSPNTSSAKKQGKKPVVVPVEEKLAMKAPEFSLSRAIGSPDFVQRFLGRLPHRQRPHRHLQSVVSVEGTVLCSMGTKRSGGEAVAYTKNK